MKKKNGFTLVELMVIMVILAAIILILLPKWGKLVDKSRDSVTKNNLNQLRTAIQMYHFENGDIYPQTLDDVDPDPAKNPPYAFIPRYMGKLTPAMLKKSLGAASESDEVKYGPGPPNPAAVDGGWLYNPIRGEIWVNHSAMDSKEEHHYYEY